MAADASDTRLFLAEDNDDLAALIERRLTQETGWRVIRAASWGEAAERLRGDRFDVVVLDYQFPDGDGLDLLDVVRETSPTTPVLFLTAHGSEKVAMEAMGRGASDYMQKTGHMLEELPMRLESLVERAGDIAISARVRQIDAPPAAAATATDEPPPSRRAAPDAKVLSAYARIVEHAIERGISGAAVFDGAGKPLAADLPDDLDAFVLGASMFQIHAQVGVTGRLTGMRPKSYVLLIQVAQGTLASTTVGTRAIATLLLRGVDDRAAAMRQLERFAGDVRDT